MADVMINWTRPMLERFKKAYSAALEKGGKDSTFVFDGHEFLVSYAKYLIEYLETKL